MKTITLILSLILLNTITLAQDRDSCISTIKGLLSWYKTNYERISSDTSHDCARLVKHGNKYIYRVNIPSCKKYLDVFRKSGYFTEKYIQGQWKKYLEADKELIKTQQIECPLGIAVLESDPLLVYQDAIEYLHKLEKMTFSNFAKLEIGLSINVNIEDLHLRYILRENKNRMLVYSIKLINE